jgi:hypothetical protein
LNIRLFVNKNFAQVQIRVLNHRNVDDIDWDEHLSNIWNYRMDIARESTLQIGTLELDPLNEMPRRQLRGLWNFQKTGKRLGRSKKFDL